MRRDKEARPQFRGASGGGAAPPSATPSHPLAPPRNRHKRHAWVTHHGMGRVPGWRAAGLDGRGAARAGLPTPMILMGEGGARTPGASAGAHDPSAAARARATVQPRPVRSPHLAGWAFDHGQSGDRAWPGGVAPPPGRRAGEGAHGGGGGGGARRLAASACAADFWGGGAATPSATAARPGAAPAADPSQTMNGHLIYAIRHNWTPARWGSRRRGPKYGGNPPPRRLHAPPLGSGRGAEKFAGRPAGVARAPRRLTPGRSGKVDPMPTAGGEVGGTGRAGRGRAGARRAKREEREALTSLSHAPPTRGGQFCPTSSHTQSLSPGTADAVDADVAAMSQGPLVTWLRRRGEGGGVREGGGPRARRGRERAKG